MPGTAGRRRLALLLAITAGLVAAGRAAAQESGEAPPEPVEFAPDDSGRDGAYLAIRDLFVREDWESVADLSEAFLAMGPEDISTQYVLYMDAFACERLRRYDACVRSCERYLALSRTAPEPDAGRREWIAFTRWMSLIQLFRGVEAKAAFEAFLAEFPHSPHAPVVREHVLPLVGPRLPAPPRGEIAPYAGRFASDPRLEREVLALREALPVAVRRVRERLGLAQDQMPAFAVRLVDTNFVVDHALMYSTLAVAGNEAYPVVSAITKHLVSRSQVLPEVLAHELAHCVRLARAGFGRFPKWVDEGLADWVAVGDDITSRAGLCRQSLMVPQGTDLVDEILGGFEADEDEQEEQQPLDSLRGYLFFRSFERAFGAERTQRLMRALTESRDHIATLEEASGLPWKRLEPKVLEGIAAVAADLFPGREDFLAAHGKLMEGEFEDALAAAEAFQEKFPDSGFTPLAAIDRAYSLMCVGRLEESAAALEACSGGPCGRSGRFKIAYYEVMLAVRQRQPERACGLAKQFLSDFYGESEGYIRRVQEVLNARGRDPREPK